VTLLWYIVSCDEIPQITLATCPVYYFCLGSSLWWFHIVGKAFKIVMVLSVKYYM